MTDDVKALLDRLDSSSRAFREHPVYDSEGDPVRLLIQADEMDEAATLIRTLLAREAAMREALEERDAALRVIEQDADVMMVHGIRDRARAALKEGASREG